MLYDAHSRTHFRVEFAYDTVFISVKFVPSRSKCVGDCEVSAVLDSKFAAVYARSGFLKNHTAVVCPFVAVNIADSINLCGSFVGQNKFSNGDLRSIVIDFDNADHVIFLSKVAGKRCAKAVEVVSKRCIADSDSFCRRVDCCALDYYILTLLVGGNFGNSLFERQRLFGRRCV